MFHKRLSRWVTHWHEGNNCIPYGLILGNAICNRLSVTVPFLTRVIVKRPHNGYEANTCNLCGLMRGSAICNRLSVSGLCLTRVTIKGAHNGNEGKKCNQCGLMRVNSVSNRLSVTVPCLTRVSVRGAHSSNEGNKCNSCDLLRGRTAICNRNMCIEYSIWLCQTVTFLVLVLYLLILFWGQIIRVNYEIRRS